MSKIASTALLLGLAIVTFTGNSAAGEDLLEFRCGEHFLQVPSFGEVPKGGLQLAHPPKSGAKAVITLDAQAGLLAQPAALAAWQSAVDIWESVLTDPVSITIEGDFQSLGAGVLGSTSSRQFTAAFDAIRNAMVSDAQLPEALLASLPTSSEFNSLLPAGFTDSGSMLATKANLRALGFDMSFDDPEPDATITFATGFLSSFDFDPSNGITAGKLDFEAVCVHEIAHALGFVSRVDYIEYVMGLSQTTAVEPSTLDMFRFLTGHGAANFTDNSRILVPGNYQSVQKLYDGFGDLGMSTGASLGDGNQASHWKAGEITGTYLGIMNPTIAPGVRKELESNDLRAMALIGWDVIDPAYVGVGDQSPPTAKLSIESVYPNPFNPMLNISYRLEDETDVRLSIFDMRGRQIRTLKQGRLEAGSHEATWDGTDAKGHKLASGVYMVRLSGKNMKVQTRVVLAK